MPRIHTAILAPLNCLGEIALDEVPLKLLLAKLLWARRQQDISLEPDSKDAGLALYMMTKIIIWTSMNYDCVLN
jgi:hypothetical protein